MTSPYVVKLTGNAQATHLQVTDTSSVDLTLTGSGTANEPFNLSGTARQKLTELADVAAGTPSNGQVPIWRTDHWEFGVPPTTAPGAVSTQDPITGDGSGGKPLGLALKLASGGGLSGSGTAADPLSSSILTSDGLTGNGTSASPAKVALSGIWGQGSMAKYPADKTLGTPIYVDDAGQVRARPMPIVTHTGKVLLDSFATDWDQWKNSPADYWYQYGPIVVYRVSATRTGAAINDSASKTGDISDVRIASLVAAMPAPITGDWGLSCPVGVINSAKMTAGAIVITAISSGGIIRQGENLTFTGWYLTNDGVLL